MKLKLKTKEKIYRVIALYLVFNLLAGTIIPTAAYALTGGPSQPEFESFEPAGTTQMVNPFTGDFNYNIPLMTVPGPNGGYPINLAYHAGIGMEQEASWVGLGWNINAGQISRGVRGLPDDFSGDEVIQEYSQKANVNVSADVNAAVYKNEIFGFRTQANMGVKLYYNNYSGVGYTFTGSGSLGPCDGTSHDNTKAVSLGASLGGDGIGVNLSYHAWNKYKNAKNDYGGMWKASMGWHSRQGISDVGISYNVGTGKKDRSDLGKIPLGAGSSFASNSYTPHIGPQMAGMMGRVGLNVGEVPATPKFNPKNISSISASFNISWPKNRTRTMKAYGYMNSQEGANYDEENFLLDFNREKEVQLNKHSEALAVPVATNDLFQAKGQGVGGAFRPFRSDVGIYSNAVDTSNIWGGQLEFEAGTDAPPTKFHIGGNNAFQQSQSYSGIWRKDGPLTGNPTDYSSIQALRFYDKTDVSSDALFEPFYFKTLGEMTASPLTETDHLWNDDPARFELVKAFDGDGETYIRPSLQGDQFVTGRYSTQAPKNITTAPYRTSRQKRIEGISYKTQYQMAQYYNSSVPKNLYATNTFPVAAGGTDPGSKYTYSVGQDHHIAEIEMLNPDGNRYVYGLPVYNTTQKEAYFSTENVSETNFDLTDNYSAADASISNNLGRDNIYSGKTLPPYVTQYLLTAVFSADYVDVTGNGPSNDDLGYWVKFNYTKTSSSYKWRAPYFDAYLNKGYHDDQKDDKLSYSYGERELYYLNSIETKTHVARFWLSSRNDARGASAEYNGSSSPAYGTSASKLDSIQLLSKIDPAYGTSSEKPLKTAVFTYDYSLCVGTANNANYTTQGKLTLLSVHFEYRGNDKGSLSPYLFTYDNSNPYDNPLYNQSEVNRWGTYKPQAASQTKFLNNETPYVTQSGARTQEDEYARAWNLKKITLPSGADIEITYETDDYAYVQDKQAMQMCQIVGFYDREEMDDPSPDPPDALSDLTDKLYYTAGKKNTLIYFKLENPVAQNTLTQTQMEAIVQKYISGIDKLYFRVYSELKNKYDGNLERAYDYVDGYCDIETGAGTYGIGPVENGYHTTGYLTLKPEPKSDLDIPGVDDMHPFRKAALQYMRMQRSDLFQPQDPAGYGYQALLGPAVALVSDLPRIAGFYNYGIVRGWANKLDLNLTSSSNYCDKKPSWVRLNTPDGIKFGGGHRVQKITSSDKWGDVTGNSNDTYSYGQRYYYVLPDGRSSGVAEYEPLTGGDEIPHHLPVRYSNDRFLVRDEALYVEEPMGESYYPAANVGYSRVITSSIVPSGVTKTKGGLGIMEFYTARDYPVIAKRTDLEKQKFPLPLLLPFIGHIFVNNRGFSQGYSIELNDMHGKPKMTAVAPAGINDANVYNANLKLTRKTVFRYQTEGVFNENGGNQLNNTVTVLDADGTTRSAEIGRTHDFFVDLQQHYNKTQSLGLQTNVDGNVFGLALPNALPIIEISRAMFRTAVTMKVIQRNGVLSEVETYADGATSVAKNLMYDAETGTPLLTQVNNNFDKPVYTYNYAAHWNYPTMKGSYKNIHAEFQIPASSITNGVISFTNAESVFALGDELLLTNVANSVAIKCWVVAVSANSITVKDESNQFPSSSHPILDAKIMRSGYRNQQVAGSGTIVSLSNPVTARYFPLFDDHNGGGWNNYASIATDDTPMNNFFRNCAGVLEAIKGVTWNSATRTLTIKRDDPFCTATLVFPSSHTPVQGNLPSYDFFYVDPTHVQAVYNGNTYLCTWNDEAGCFTSCLDDVLHADASRFSDTWSFDYSDYDQLQDGDPNISAVTGTLNGYNVYRAGKSGIWRTQSNYLYQVDRKQSSSSASKTDISKDGTYKEFSLYNWHITPQSNKDWSYVSQVTKYNPQGIAIESRDALGVYSASLTGYRHSLGVASAANCSYFELAFDAFEDYTSTTYDSHGHFDFQPVSSSTISVESDFAHTGKKSLALTATSAAEFVTYPVANAAAASGSTYFRPIAGQRYQLSVWVKAPASGQKPSVTIDNGTSQTTYTSDDGKSAIEGWKKIDIDFTAPTSVSTPLKIKLTNNATVVAHANLAFFDDIRLQPFKSAMSSTVYDPATNWVVAELDNRNFATFYIYDEEGAVIQVKQETEKGIITLQTGRGNIKR